MNLILALISFTLLVAFLSILAFTVNIPDLTIIIAITVLMCGFDFIRSVRSKEEH